MNNTIYSRLQSLPLVLHVASLLFLSPSLSPNLLHSFGSPLCLIASAPPYNHAGSWLSFGVVYIAVIVRVQYRDWAEHVYSFTGQLCNKSGSGEERIGFEGGVYTCTQARAHM